MNFVGKHIIELESVESTNSELKKLASTKELEEGTLLLAEEQTKGRGQVNAGWESERVKNFTGTYLLKPKFDLMDVFDLNLIVSLAVLAVTEEYIGESLHDLKIKWPNDIVVDGKKIAGILIENQIQSNQISESYIGIGYNLNQLTFSEFSRKATSLGLELDREINKMQFTEKLSIQIQQYYMLYKTKGYNTLHKLYQNALYLKDEWSIYKTPVNQEFKLIGVDKSGKLILESRNNQKKNFDIKAIQFSK